MPAGFRPLREVIEEMEGRGEEFTEEQVWQIAIPLMRILQFGLRENFLGASNLLLLTHESIYLKMPESKSGDGIKNT